MYKSKIEFYEPYFFMFFGIFHMHRIWGIIDRKSYAHFWINLMNDKGLFYYILMGILASLCILGIITFFKNLHNNYWWRWIYIIGGCYVLFDLFCIAFKFTFWKDIILLMYDTYASYWNVLWCSFIILGTLVFILGLSLLRKRKNYAE